MAIDPRQFGQMSEAFAEAKEKLSAGHYTVQLAENERQIQAAQQLRYEVLFKESGGRISEQMRAISREEDEWDTIAYHVVVLDHDLGDEVVGTVRLVSSQNLVAEQTLYTEHAFDLSKLRARYQHVLELSRACVSAQGRSGVILMLMWKFTMQFIEQNRYDVMLGCASFSGTDYQQHGEILSYLYKHHLAPSNLMPIPIVDNFVPIREFKIEPAQDSKPGKVPTLLRGYLKIGAQISEDAIIDPVFNTTFVAIYVDAQQMFGSGHVLVHKVTE